MKVRMINIWQIVMMSFLLWWINGNAAYAETEIPMDADEKNLIYNSNLENWANPDLPDGWTTTPRPERETSDLISVDETGAFLGKRCMKIRITDKTIGTTASAAAFFMPGERTRPEMEKGVPYTFSAYVKADQDEKKAVLQVLYPNYQKAVVLDKKWKRFSLVFTPEKSTRTMTCGVKFLEPGSYWIDAVQLEKGDKITDYADSPEVPSWAHKYDNSIDISFPYMSHNESDGPDRNYYTTEASMEFRVCMKVPQDEMSRANVFVRIEDSEGKPVFTTDPVPYVSEQTNISVDMRMLPVGIFTGRGLVRIGNKEVLAGKKSIVKLPAMQTGNEVKVERRAKCLLVNGEKYLPIGSGVTYENVDDLQKINTTLDKIKEWSAVNTIFVWRWEDRTKNDCPSAPLQAILDAALMRKFMVIINLGTYLAKGKEATSDPEKINKVEQLVGEFRHHPALLAWYLIDEPAIRPSETERFLKTLKLADPYHPFIVNGWDERNSYAHLNATDIVSISYYPVPFIPVDSVAAKARLLGTYTTGRPVNLWMQGWGARSYDSLREPSVQELVSMDYQAFISGVSSILYYTEDLRPNSFALMQGMASIKKEVDQINKVILAQPDSFSSEGDVDAVLKLVNGNWWLLSVNKSNKNRDATFTLPQRAALPKTIGVVFEGRSISSVNQNRFADKYAPFERHIYTWERKKTE